MRKGHKKLLKFFILWMVATAAIMAYNATHKLRPGEIMITQRSNGEIVTESRPGYHFVAGGTVMIYQKSLLERTDKLGGTLYEGKTTVGEHFDLASPNKNLVRIK